MIPLGASINSPSAQGMSSVEHPLQYLEDNHCLIQTAWSISCYKSRNLPGWEFALLKKVKKRFTLYCQKTSDPHEKPKSKFPTLEILIANTTALPLVAHQPDSDACKLCLVCNVRRMHRNLVFSGNFNESSCIFSLSPKTSYFNVSVYFLQYQQAHRFSSFRKYFLSLVSSTAKYSFHVKGNLLAPWFNVFTLYTL